MVRKTMLRVLVVVLFVVGVVGARYYLAGHRVPAGQPPLAELTSGSLDSAKAYFNRTADGVRIILLLSPT